MRKAMKWLARILIALVLAVVLALSAVYALSQKRMDAVYTITPPPFKISTDADAVARGKHLADIRGCRGCHGPNLAGHTFINAPLMARLSGANLTAGRVGGALSDLDIVRALRHGVARNGHSLLFMPAQEFSSLSAQDMGDLLAYLHTVPAVDHTPPPNTVGPLGRVMFLAGKIPLLPAELVNHQQTIAAVAPTTPVAHGAYLAQVCSGCHGRSFSGGPIPGTPPDWTVPANLTPDATGLADWTEADLRHALRDGIARGGRKLNIERMPVGMTRNLTDAEISAIYTYLRSLPPRPWGKR
jgi:mono/diheme cytochrome c family protein